MAIASFRTPAISLKYIGFQPPPLQLSVAYSTLEFFSYTVMETIIRGGLLDTLPDNQLGPIEDYLHPGYSTRLRKLLHHKLQFGTARNEYFPTAMRECLDFYCQNTTSSSPQQQQQHLDTLFQQLLDAASTRWHERIRAEHGEKYNLVKRLQGLDKEITFRTSWSHSSSNHILAAMSYIGDEGLVRLYLRTAHELDLRVSYAFGGPIKCAASQGHFHIVKLLIEAHGDPKRLLPDRDISIERKLEAYQVFGAALEALCAAAFGGHIDMVLFLADLLSFDPICTKYPGLRYLLDQFAYLGGHESIFNELVHPTLFSTPSTLDAPRYRLIPAPRQLPSHWPMFDIRSFKPRDTTNRIMAAFRFGVAFGHESLVTLVLTHDASKACTPYQDDNKLARRQPPFAPGLVHAARYGRENIVRILLQAGAGQTEGDLKDAAVMASQYGFKRVVQSLFDYQEEHGVANKTLLLQSCFQSAAGSGQVDIIELLFSLGLNLDSPAVREAAVSVALEDGYSCVERMIKSLTESDVDQKR
jgi:hypothetical protein